jgi:hypothetical protein
MGPLRYVLKWTVFVEMDAVSFLSRAMDEHAGHVIDCGTINKGLDKFRRCGQRREQANDHELPAIWYREMSQLPEVLRHCVHIKSQSSQRA